MKSTCSSLDVNQDAVYRIALGVEALLLNGIQFCVLEPIASDGFLHEKSATVLADLSSLEDQLQQVPEPDREHAVRVLDGIKHCIMDLVDELAGLMQLQSKSQQDIRASVARLVALRAECMREIKAVESILGIPRPFFEARPAQSNMAMDSFMASLEHVLTEAWSAQRSG